MRRIIVALMMFVLSTITFITPATATEASTVTTKDQAALEALGIAIVWRSESDQTTLPMGQSTLMLAQSPSPATQPSPSQQIWGCNAQSGTRRYVVDQLIPREKSFDIAIYEGSGNKDSDYIGTVQANLIKDGNYSAQTYNSTLDVFAFSGRTPDFTVKDSVGGQASGRCYVQTQMADDETRQLVRQCLALAERKFGSLAEAQRSACVGAPTSSLEELQRQK